MSYRCSYYNVQLSSSCRNISIESMFNRGGNRDCGPGLGGGGGTGHEGTNNNLRRGFASSHQQNDTMMFQNRDAFQLSAPLHKYQRQFYPNPSPPFNFTPFNVAINRFVASAPTSMMIPVRTMTTPIRPWVNAREAAAATDKMNNGRSWNDASNVKRHKYDVPNTSSTETSSNKYRRSFYANHGQEMPSEEQGNTIPDEASANSFTDDTSCYIRKVVDSIRKWEYTEQGMSQRKNPQPGVEFTIVCYNILAQCLLEDNWYLYKNCLSDDLEWNHRRKGLMDEFRRSEADILCLQEVQCDHYEQFFKPSLLEMGYSSRYKKRTGSKKDGCAVFYKKSVFKLEKWRSVEYCKTGIDVLDRDNIALMLMLRPRDGTEMVCVVNTHLLFNPNRGDIKLAQMRILMAEVDRFAFRCHSRSKRAVIYHPVIMCGDMNSKPHCHLYKFVSTGTLNYEGLAASDISGQNESHNRRCLAKELVPSSLGISDRCQYVKTVKKRFRATTKDDGHDSRSDAETTNSLEPNLKFKFSSGRMSHKLNLISCYTHKLCRLGGKSEVTTHHGKSSCTVDYIFYMVNKKDSIIENHEVIHKNVSEGSLQLLATYGLLSSNELQNIGGLPNTVQPSDHIPLIARFLLRN